jgi:hypothetical protein
MRERRTWMPIGTSQPLPAGTTVADAVADLRFVMSRYPSMRTRLRLDRDGPRQVVAAAGEIALEIVDAADGSDPATVAAEVWTRYANVDYDFATDWPLRMAVIRHRGALTHRVWVMCHLATDGGGARVILEELADREHCHGATALPPLEQARWQRSPAGQRQSRAALRYWEGLLRELPPSRFPDRAERPYPRYWQGRWESRATELAVRASSARTGVEIHSVLLAVFAVALARITGINPVVTQVTVGNRFRPPLARTVSPVMQSGLCVIDVGDATFDEVVARTRRRAMIAYKNGYYDPDRREELIARVNRERGEDVDLTCTFNDWRLKPRDGTGPPPTPEQIRAALPDASLRWHYRQDEVRFDSLYLNVDEVPDTVRITVLTDIHVLAPSDVEACLRGMEEVAVEGALDPAARTRVPAGAATRVRT